MAIERFLLGPKQYIDISGPAPKLHKAKFLQRLFRWVYLNSDTRFFVSGRGLTRLAARCNTMWTQISPPPLATLIQIQELITQVAQSPDRSPLTKCNATRIASCALATIDERTKDRSLPISTDVAQHYISAVRNNLPDLQKEALTKSLNVAEQLQTLFPAQAFEVAQTVYQSAVKLRTTKGTYNNSDQLQKPYSGESAFPPTGVAEVSDCKKTVAAILNSAYLTINPKTDPSWKDKLHVLLSLPEGSTPPAALPKEVTEAADEFIKDQYVQQMPPDIISRIDWLIKNKDPSSVWNKSQEAYKQINAFIEEQFRSLPEEIGQGKIPLNSLGNPRQNFQAIIALVERYKSAIRSAQMQTLSTLMDSLQKALGNYASEFFKLYAIALSHQLIPTLRTGFIGDSTLTIQSLIHIPKPPTYDHSDITTIELQNAFQAYLTLYFKNLRPVDLFILLRVAQQCYWMKNLFPSLVIKSFKLSDIDIRSIISKIQHSAPYSHDDYQANVEKYRQLLLTPPLSGMLPSLTETEREKPEQLFGALPIDEEQKALLIKTYQNTLKASH